MEFVQDCCVKSNSTGVSVQSAKWHAIVEQHGYTRVTRPLIIEASLLISLRCTRFDCTCVLLSLVLEHGSQLSYHKIPALPFVNQLSRRLPYRITTLFRSEPHGNVSVVAVSPGTSERIDLFSRNRVIGCVAWSCAWLSSSSIMGSDAL